MKTLKTALVLKTVLITLFFTANDAHAYNDWYRQGYTDATISSEQMCETKTRNALYELSLENARLKKQLSDLHANGNAAQVVSDKPLSNTLSANTMNMENFYQMRDLLDE